MLFFSGHSSGQAQIDNGVIHLKGLVCSPDGKQMFRAER
jgi:hypothetical protein